MILLKYDELKQICITCRKCPLCETRKNVVFGAGVADAEILFIGEAPGQNEDEQALPFVGRSGKLLDEYCASAGLSRETNIFITNIIKCRPPDNRDPLPHEWDACMPYLNEQIAIMQPKIIMCLGRIAAQRLIRPDFSVMKEHGVWSEKDGIFYTATLHPAALLRNPHNKPLAAADFVEIHKKAQEICAHTLLVPAE